MGSTQTARIRRFVLLSAIGLLGLLPAQVQAQVSFTRADSLLGVHVVDLSYGPTWGDFNGDEIDELFSGNHGDYPNLYSNTDGTSWIDVWQGSGIPLAGDRHGAAWGDMDNDGRLDLYVTVGAQMGVGVGYNQLYRNLDGAHFEDLSWSAGTVDSLGRGRFAHWIDADNDGLLDIFVGNMDTPNRLFINRGDGTFYDTPGANGLGDNGLWYAAWAHLSSDRLLDVALAGSWSCLLSLFRNRGDGTFQDVTSGSGLPHTLVNASGLCWIDYDNDGDEDLYCSRGYTADSGDAFWSDSSSTLQFLAYLPDDPDKEDGADGIAISADCTGLRISIHLDWDNRPYDHISLGSSARHPTSMPFFAGDGQYVGRPPHTPGLSFGCYIWQDYAGAPWQIECSTNYGTLHRFGGVVTVVSGSILSIETQGIEVPVTPPNVSDRFFRNNGNGTFTDVTQAAGIADSLDGHTCISADFDNDGWLDLYVVNGRNLSGYFAVNGPNLLYLNNGNGTFRECGAAAGVDNHVPGTAASAGWSDYDEDGFPDLFVTNGYGEYPFFLGPQVVYHNEGNGNHWLKVRLVGTLSNRDATGARVRLWAGGRRQYRTQFGGVNDMAQSSMSLIFGLGYATFADSLSIEWPSGETDTYRGLAVDQTYVIVEETGAALAPDRRSPPLRLALEPTAPNPLRDRARLAYRLPSAGHVRLEIYDVAGRWVRTLVDGTQPAGNYTVTWDARDASGRRLPRGIYCSRLRTEGGASARRPLVVD